MDLTRAAFTLVMAASLAAGLALGASDARAQTPSEIATAKGWFADGLALEEKGDFAAALALFRRAAEVKKTPQIIYHIGFCESRTGALVLALVDLDSAAAMARAAGTAKVIDAAQAALIDVKARVPSLEVRVAPNDKATRLTVDGHPLALAMVGTPMPLDPGDHTVTVDLASGASVTRKATLAEHDAKVVQVSAGETVPVATALPPAVVAPVVALPPQEPTTARSPAPWVVTGIGGVATIVGVALVATAHAKLGDIDCPSHTGCTSGQGTYNSAVTLNGVGVAVGIVGLATAGVGITWVIARPSATTSTAFVVTPSGVELTGRF